MICIRYAPILLVWELSIERNIISLSLSSFHRRADENTQQRLATQLRSLSVPFTEDFLGALKETDHIVDAIFGKSPFSLFQPSGTLTKYQGSPSRAKSASPSQP